MTLAAALCFLDADSRRLLWFDRAQACEFAQARALIHHCRQQVRHAQYGTTTVWHVSSVSGERRTAA